ncbi:MAG: nucleotidyltransferase domain-containing protein, partial [Oscillospiraceae bacterium]|nr:nucleotidyltransferase domain-containing protein [Oscillospiraceae bacterium]
MVDIERWMEALAGKLTGVFGPRLLFLGLQGSYGRGEANEDSDIDVVTVLDRVELADLDAYRAVVRDMPEGEKACGFLCGAEELRSWPKYDLLAVARDTRD